MFEQGRGVQPHSAHAYTWYLIAARLGGDAEARGGAERLRPTLSPVAQANAERNALSFRPTELPAPALTRALAAWRSSLRLDPTGQADPQTLQRLASAAG